MWLRKISDFIEHVFAVGYITGDFKREKLLRNISCFDLTYSCRQGESTSFLRLKISWNVTCGPAMLCTQYIQLISFLTSPPSSDFTTFMLKKGLEEHTAIWARLYVAFNTKDSRACTLFFKINTCRLYVIIPHNFFDDKILFFNKLHIKYILTKL